jgi:hypothetical protein
MESFDRDGNVVVTPIYGDGQGENVGGSRYAHLADADADAPYVLGGGQTEEQSRFHNVPEPPRLRDGSIDYDRLNEMNGHTDARSQERHHSEGMRTMPGRTILDDTPEQTAEDKRRYRDREFGDKEVKDWGRKWIEAKRRGGVDREVDWYANNNRRYR